jgi:8-oxo-dGTP pyrophosphatase MutT (NUDIX family)
MSVGHRLSSRILLFDESGRVLLFLTKARDSRPTARWITPGGGVDPGEEHAGAAVRELAEETGLSVASLDGPVWQHDFEVPWAGSDHDSGHAEFYLHQTTQFTPSKEGWTPEEHVDVLASRWWTVDELLASNEPYEPAELPDLIRRFSPSPR